MENDYYLTPSEKRLLELACGHFENVMAVFNCNGMVDMSCTKTCPNIKAALFMGTAGEQAAGALADLITGRATPSGKLISLKSSRERRRYSSISTGPLSG